MNRNNKALLMLKKDPMPEVMKYTNNLPKNLGKRTTRTFDQ
jgi:hypothetical protein